MRSEVLISVANSMSWIRLAGWLRCLLDGTLTLEGELVAWLDKNAGLEGVYSCVSRYIDMKVCYVCACDGDLTRLSRGVSSGASSLGLAPKVVLADSRPTSL